MKYLLSEIARICCGTFAGCDRTVSEVLTDSRCHGWEGEPLFVAMQGRNHDSHAFLAQMYGRGVRAFLVEREPEAGTLPEGCGIVRVDDSLTALQRLAADHRQYFRGTVVGITGSNGKTVVKEWIAQAIPPGVRLFRSPRSYNSQLGVALSLLMIAGDEQAALIEAGISEPGEMERLERMIRPDTVLFTSIGDAHQEHFDSLEQKIDEKLRLACGARRIIFHSAYGELAAAVALRYGDRLLCDAAGAAVDGLSFADGASVRNAQLVATLCEAMGYPAPDFRCLQPVAMRLEVKDGIHDSILIDDAYNADINSLAIALDYLHAVAAGRPTTLVLSDILQSGMDAETLYGRIAQLVAAAGVGRMVGIGPEISRHAALFACPTACFASTDEYLAHFDREAVAGRAVLLKGSRASRFERIGRLLERKSHTTVLEVDLDAMIHNLNYFRAKLRPGVRMVAMVKAGSYGAGDFEVAQMLQHQGVHYLAVAFADEGVLLRERGITMPVVVLNADEGSFEAMIRARLEPEIYNFRSLHDFAAAASRHGERHFPIHLKLDTGMHRLGFMEEELDALCRELEQLGSVRVASVFSHLNCADMPAKDDYTRAQIARFDRMSGRLAAMLPYPVLRHTANSAAIERFAKAQFDMCRLGLGLYGFGFAHNEALRPVSSLRTRIVQLRRLSAGEAVGYGAAEVLARDSLVATVPVGYADGLDRHLGCGRWAMRVAGQPAPIVGRICMDSCMIDVTDIADVREGDEAVVFSAVPGNDPETMARVLDTIPYEIMTAVSGRVKRIYLKEQ